MFFSNFWTEVVGHLGDSRVILVKALAAGGTKKLEPINLLSEEIGKVKSNANLEDELGNYFMVINSPINKICK